ncbi:hypothetical protein [Tsukamurella ocularis]|uniref:hypothetical protein n=1 Tax=Tsukamurella ocularis TaxID=1970234 RepID=UPI002166FA14|nr:hypothetical protein [Tsukamurella ocularis]MCS3779631.1 hypothetical protein [Tsukamurella ocularis]MCS3788969.1 hypothetical protein [Tsukamurella ocularis]MCS3850179.1 hypothetical protein [Tsukamurella ocularis]
MTERRRVLIQGAGAVSAAAGVLLAGTGAEVRAASRRDDVILTAVDPRGVVAHVPVVRYADVEPGTVDLLVLTSAPGELDDEVAAALAASRPRVVGVTSPVIGDAAIAQRVFPGADVATLAPGLLSFATSRGTETRAEYWVPPLTPAFSAVAVEGSSRDLPRRLVREYPAVIGRVPARAVAAVGTLMVPYAAELAVVGGDWPTFLRRLRRPGRAMAEAMRVDVGLPVFAPPAIVVRAVLRQLCRTAPFDFPKFAGNHFVRHADQSLRILDAWRAMTPRATPALDSLREDLAAAL